MECRLCLYISTAESFVPIYEDNNLLVKRILNCCQFQVEKDDGFPDTICLSCERKLKILTDFKKSCFQNDETMRLRSAECFNVKVEEVLLDDLDWKDEHFHSNLIPPSNVTDQSSYPEEKSSNIDELSPVNEDFNAEVKHSMMENANEADDSNERHKCEICSKCFTSNAYLTVHMGIHPAVKPYTCKMCFKYFETNDELIEHVKHYTAAVKLPKCEICSKYYAANSDLKVHMISHTVGETLHKCVVCSKDFGTNSELKRHLKRHIGAKPHTCDVCFKGFVANFELKLHMKRHTKKNHASVSYRKNFSIRPKSLI